MPSTDRPRRVEVFFWEAVRTKDGRDCGAIVDVRVCFRGNAVDSVRRDVGRDWSIEAHHAAGTLFRDEVSGDRFRSERFTGEAQRVALETGPLDGGRLTIQDDDLWVWNGVDFELAMLPGRVVTAALDGEEVEALVEPGVVWRGEPTDWNMLRWKETHYAPDGVGMLRGAELARREAAAARVQALVNDMLRTGELELGRRSGERRAEERHDLAWSWSSAPARPELVLDGVLPAFGQRRNADLLWDIGASGFGLVRQGSNELGTATRVEWMGLDRDGHSFLTVGETPAASVRTHGPVLAAHPGWVLRAEFADREESFDGEEHECDLVLIRANAQPFRRRWHRCAVGSLGALSLPLSDGRTGVLVHDGAYRQLLEIDSAGRLLGERSILGPYEHRDEWIQEVHGQLAHVVARGTHAKAHFVDGANRIIERLRAPAARCSDDTGEIVAASHLAPRANVDGSTDDRLPEPRLWRSHWIARASSGTCVRAGFSLHPRLAWWADGQGIRGWRWDARYGPASMHEGVEAERIHGYSASIATRDSELFVLMIDERSVRVLRVNGPVMDELAVPRELADPHDPPRLGPDGALEAGGSGDDDWPLVAGRSGSPALGMLMRSGSLPSAESCARVELRDSSTLTPPIGCRDSAFAVSADERLVAYHGRVIGAENPSHVRIARRVGDRWAEWGAPLEERRPLSGIWVDDALYLVAHDGERWLLRTFRHGRWSTRALVPSGGRSDPERAPRGTARR